jgi:hypothetical protein
MQCYLEDIQSLIRVKTSELVEVAHSAEEWDHQPFDELLP